MSVVQEAQREAQATIQYLGFDPDKLRYDCRVRKLYGTVLGSVIEYGLDTVHPTERDQDLIAVQEQGEE